MKKIQYIFAAFALAASLCFVSCQKEEENNTPEENPSGVDYFADLEPSTETENRHAILEEYTGVNCGYCPDGHRISRDLAQQYEGRYFAINIHQGSFANKYTTQWGNALANQAGIDSYPSGTINRHVFSGSMSQSRGYWAQRVNYITNRTSCVNLAARCVVDTTSREMQICVKGRYTAKSDSATNMLNIALLQDSILGPQSDPNNYNAADHVGSKYRHMHMLRDLITDQWGDEITTTKRGDTFEKRYTYQIPEKISDEKVVLKDIEVIVFVALGRSEITTGIKADIILK